jgi:arsenite methyltransferase
LDLVSAFVVTETIPQIQPWALSIAVSTLYLPYAVQEQIPASPTRLLVDPTRRQGSYGIDAPYLLPVPAVPIAVNVVNGIISGTVWPFVGAAVILACTGMGLYASRRGKFVVWAMLLDQLSLRGHERILDIGCGRGAILLLAAERLVSGRAVGVDLWKKGDQSGNAEEATLRNAKAESVAERVELHTADMTALPFDDNTFDVILSNLAIHNVKGRAGRAQAIAQAVRVLLPGGRLMIADILGTRLYRTCLVELGMLDMTSRSLGWRMWWSGPWLATRLLTATKPLKAEIVCSPVS